MFKWSFKEVLPVVVPVTCALAILVLPWKSPSHADNEMSSMHPRNTPDPAYRKAFAGALQAGTEGLERAFAIVGSSTLAMRMGGLSQVAQSDGRIGAIDLAQPSVYLFSPSGRLKFRIGQPGLGPGEYVSPSGIAFGPHFLAISDFSEKRVSLFDNNGEVMGSFTYGPQGFSAQGLAYDPRSDQFFLFGNRWSEYSGERSIQLVHRYTSGGDFKGSAFSLPTSAETMKLTSYDQPLTEAEGYTTGPADADPVRFMLPWQNVLYSVSAGGQVSTVLDAATDSAFRGPASPLPLEGGDIAAFQRWTRTWTPIVGFATDGDRAVIETQCLCPARYRLAVWSISQHTLLDSLFTNRKLVTRGGDHTFFFLEEPSDPKESNYVVVRARLDK